MITQYEVIEYVAGIIHSDNIDKIIRYLNGAGLIHVMEEIRAKKAKAS